jgi:LDH2 family malate/lactate/ureidoglycolate dehydrogenase
MRESETLPGHDAVRIPGDRHEAIFKDRAAHGIPLHPNLLKALSEIAAELAIDDLARPETESRA